MNKKIAIIIIGIIVIIVVIPVIGLILEELDMKGFEKENKEALSKLSVKVPKQFEKNEYGSSIYYNYYKDDVDCSLRIEAEKGNYRDYVDGKDYLEDTTYISLKDKVSEIKEIKINNYKWHYLTLEKNGDIEYHYATINEDNIYDIVYKINDYTNGENANNYCISIKDEIISTVKLK